MMQIREQWYCERGHANERHDGKCGDCGLPRPEDVDFVPVEIEDDESANSETTTKPASNGSSAGTSGLFDDSPAFEAVSEPHPPEAEPEQAAAQEPSTPCFNFKNHDFHRLEELAQYIDTHFDECQELLEPKQRERLLLWASEFGLTMKDLQSVMTEASKTWEERLEALRYILNPLSERPAMAVNPQRLKIRVAKGARSTRKLTISNTGAGRIHGRAVLRDGNRRGAFRLESSSGERSANVPFRGQKSSIQIIANARGLESGDKRSTVLTLAAPNARIGEIEVELDMKVGWSRNIRYSAIVGLSILLISSGAIAYNLIFNQPSSTIQDQGGGITVAEPGEGSNKTKPRGGTIAEVKDKGSITPKPPVPEPPFQPQVLHSSNAIWPFKSMVGYIMDYRSNNWDIALTKNYAPRVNFLNRGPISKDEVQNYWLEQFKEWPKRKYRLVSVDRVTELKKDALWRVESTVEIDWRNPASNQILQRPMQVVLTLIPGGEKGFLIVEEKTNPLPSTRR